MRIRSFIPALLISLAATQAGELLVSPPVTAPITYRPWWRLEEALFGYKPEFDAGIACFGPDNEPYLRFGEQIQMLDDEGRWIRVPPAPAVKRIFSSWDGVFMQGYFAEEHVVFDDAGDAYTVLNATRSSIGRVFLLHSRDRCRSWKAYPVGIGYGRLERGDGHTRMPRPPALLVHDSALRGVLQLVVLEKRADGTLDVSHSKVISEDSLLVANHSGGGNSVITIGHRVHVFFPGKRAIPGKERAGTPEYAVTYDLSTRTMTGPVFLGLGGSGKPDPHNIPVVSADSEGFLHVVLGAHHNPFKYTRSLVPDSTTDGWTPPEQIGTPKRSPNEGSYTYVGLVCDPDDTLHVVGRWAGESYTFKLGYLRKPKGKPWEPNRNLVVPFKGNYHIWYHKLTIDRRGRLFLNYVCRASVKRSDEVPSFGKKWPREELTGRFLTRSHCLLMSADGGDTWRLATTHDLGGKAGEGGDAPLPPPKPHDAQALPAGTTALLGGRFRELAMSGDFLLAGVGRRVLVLAAGDPAALRLVGQAGPFGDTIYDIAVRDGLVAVAAWRDGLHLFTLNEDGTLTQRGAWKAEEARRFDWHRNHIYMTCGKAGLRILDVSDPEQIREIGRLANPHLCAIAVKDGLAYGAVGPRGMSIMDVSDPTAPSQLNTMFTPRSANDRKNAAYNVTVSSDVLYVCPGPALSCLRVFSLADPRNPGETADIEQLWGWGRPVQVHGNRLFLASLKGLQVLDATTEARLAGSWGDRTISGVAARGDTVFVSRGTDGIAALDVSDAAAIRPIGAYSQPKTPFGCTADSTRLFVADWDVGVRILNLTTPDMPAEETVLKEYPRVFGLDAADGRLALALGVKGAVVMDTTNQTDTLRIPTESGIRDVALDHGTLFLAEEGQGIRIRDLSAVKEDVVVATPRDVLSLAVAEGRLYVGEAQKVRGGIRVYAMQGGSWTEVGYLELGNDVWDLAAHRQRLYAAQADRGVLMIATGAAADLRVKGRIDTNGSIAWGATPAAGRLYIAVGADGLQVRDF